jgi:hypothetical protein
MNEAKWKWLECVRCGYKWPKGHFFKPSEADCCINPLIHIIAHDKDYGKPYAAV